jgi:hypothetical protein
VKDHDAAASAAFLDQHAGLEREWRRGIPG